jgi:outer membrane protein assembly factor BamB
MMRVLHRCLVFATLLAAVLAVSCITSTDRQADTAARARPSKLSPANATFDLEAEGMKRLWPQELGQLSSNRRLKNIYSAGALVVVEAAEGEIHCLEASSGVWKSTAVLEGPLSMPPAAMGDTLFLAVGSTLFTYDVGKDQLSRGYNPQFPLFVAPLLRGNELILAGGNGHLATLTLVGEKQTFLASLNGPIFERPVISAGRLYASATGDKAIAWDLDRGLELWRWGPQRPSEITTGVAVIGDRVYVGDNRGFLYSLDAEHGAETWKAMFEAPLVGRPEVVGSKLVVFTDKPSMVCLDGGGERQELWRLEGGCKLLTVGKRAFYALTQDHCVVAIQPDSGKELWRQPLPEDCCIVGDAARPVLYIADTAGSIVALAELD